MLEIKDLLLNFRNILLLQEDKEEIIIKIILEITNLQLKKENFHVKNGVLYLNTKPLYKNEIFIKSFS